MSAFIFGALNFCVKFVEFASSSWLFRLLPMTREVKVHSQNVAPDAVAVAAIIIWGVI